MKKKMTERRFTPMMNMKHFLEKIADHGDKPVFKYFDKARNLHEITYPEFSAKATAEAAGFDALGLAGGKIAIAGETSPEWVMTYVSSIASGGVAIPLDRELSAVELGGFMRMVDADAVAFSKSFEAKALEMASSCPDIKKFICFDPDGVATDDERFVTFDRVIEAGKGNIDSGYTMPDPTDMNNLAEYLFTSGTTGTSKCVMLSQKNVCSTINCACECVEFFPEDTIVSVLPIHHTYELCCLIAGMNYGMTIGINDSLKHILKNLETFRPTGLVLVPLIVNTMYKRIWDTAKKTGRDKALRFGIKASRTLRKIGFDRRAKFFGEVVAAFGGRLERIVCGGAPLNAQMVKNFEEFGITVMEGYGITECSPLVSVNPYFALKSGSVGPAVSCCEAKIVDGAPNADGVVVGEICVKGDNVMLGYYQNEEENARVFTEDGYFRTGDMGYLDKDGYIYITGRKKSVIILESGKNVYPEEIEEYLEKIDLISEVVVVGRKIPADDTILLTAVVYPDANKFEKDATKDEMLEAIKAQIMLVNKKLPNYKHIKDIELRDTEFEKTTSRKIKRHLVS